MSQRSSLRCGRVAVLFALFILAVACGGDGPSAPDSPYDENTRPEDVEYSAALVALGVDFDEMTPTQTGMYIRDLEVGTGAVAEPGDSLQVAYTGWLPDGTVFDAGAQPFEFDLLPGRAIAGWVEGLEGVRVGGRRLLVIPWWLGYGRFGSGPIPPYAPLVFETELLQIF